MPFSRLPALTLAAALSASAPALADGPPPYEYAEPVGAVTVDRPLPGVRSGNTDSPYYREGPAPGMAYAHGSHAGMAYGSPHRFDRDAWLADCRDRIRGVRRSERGQVIGGLLGAIAGGVIGNRAWDSQRLAGTLVGAGVGGLAGVAIGSAIAAAGKRDRSDECALYLDDYWSRGGWNYGAGYPGYGPGSYGHWGTGYWGYVYGYGYAMMPVMVAVPQRQVVHETVTEEWVESGARRHIARPAAPKTVPYRAPSTDKRIRYSKGK